MRSWQRALCVSLLAGPLALLSHHTALAGQYVDPATLNPPPPGIASCMAVGNGANGTICTVLFPVLDPPAPSGIVCGSGSATLELLASDSGERVGTRFYDQTGNLTRRIVRQDVTGTFTNPLTGASVQFVTRANEVDMLTIPGNFDSAVTTFTGPMRVYLPSGRVILMDTGRSVWSPDGTNLAETGQHPFDAYFAFGDPTALEAICQAVGAL